MVHVLRFQLNDNIDRLTSEQITEIAETVTENIESRYPEGQAPCNLAVQIMRLSMKLIEKFAQYRPKTRGLNPRVFFYSVNPKH